MFAITKSYIWQYSKQQPTDQQVETFIKGHASWVTEAFTLCPPLDEVGVS
jgi:hypothetical protein